MCPGDFPAGQGGQQAALWLTDWDGRISASAAPYPKPNARYRVAFLSPDISPVRVQGGQRLVARRLRPQARFGAQPSAARLLARRSGETPWNEAASFDIGRGKKIWRFERHEPLPPVSLYSRSDKPRPERDWPTPTRGERQALASLSAYPSRQARRAAS